MSLFRPNYYHYIGGPIDSDDSLDHIRSKALLCPVPSNHRAAADEKIKTIRQLEQQRRRRRNQQRVEAIITMMVYDDAVVVEEDKGSDVKHYIFRAKS